MAIRSTPRVEPHELSDEEAAAKFDRIARRNTGMSGPEFVKKWRAGEIENPDDDPKVIYVAMLLPLVDEPMAPGKKSHRPAKRVGRRR